MPLEKKEKKSQKNSCVWVNSSGEMRLKAGIFQEAQEYQASISHCLRLCHQETEWQSEEVQEKTNSFLD